MYLFREYNTSLSIFIWSFRSMHKLINPETVFNSLQYGFSQAVLTQGGRQLFLSGQVTTD